MKRKYERTDKVAHDRAWRENLEKD